MRNLTQHGLYALLVLGVVAVILPAAARPALAQTTWYVDVEATTHGDGEVWDGPFEFLQEALQHEDLTSGDDIWVAGGVYYPDLPNDEGDQTVSFVLVPGVTIKGGYHGQCSGVCGDPALRNEVSILSGDINGGGPPAGRSQTILFADYPDSGAITVDGFTISDGYADGTTPTETYWEEFGGGVYIVGGPGDLTFNDCIFENNYAENGGGGLFVQSRTAVTFTGCDFKNNQAGTPGGSGGGLFLVNCTTLQIGGTGPGDGCTFDGNTARAGGAVNIQNTATTIEHCVFTLNTAEGVGAVGGAIKALECAALKDFTVSDCTFDRNKVNDNVGGNGYGGAMGIKGYKTATFTRTDFPSNQSSRHAAALFVYSEDLENPPGTCYLGTVTIDDCDFIGNTCDLDDEGEEAGLGGAIWARNITLDCYDSDFIGNEAGEGGGAIWFEAFILGNGDNLPYFGDASLTLTDCLFRDNTMDSTITAGGGGALFMDGNKDGTEETNLTGTITGCTFVGNVGRRGGGIYIHNSDRVDIETCKFIANYDPDAIDPDYNLAGGGIGIGDPADLKTTEVYICQSEFVSNKSVRGGAIHNHEGARTYAVNCVIAGNSSSVQGGGVFNSKHTGIAEVPAEMYMHNCLIAGNVASFDMGGGVFNGLGSDPAVMELIQCTLLGNHAGYKYGGAVNESGDEFCRLKFYNCISRGNTSVSESDTFKNQLYHIDGYDEGDVSNFVAAGTLPAVYTDTPTWTGDDPDFLDEGSTTVAWDESDYDASVGETTFTLTSSGNGAAGMLFKPDPDETEMLLIKQVIVYPSGPDDIVCYGKWPDQTPMDPIDGKLFDLHIDDTGSAYNFGNSTYYPLDNGVCDLDPNLGHDLLKVDLDLVARSGNPDSGAYEDN